MLDTFTLMGSLSKVISAATKHLTKAMQLTIPHEATYDTPRITATSKQVQVDLSVFDS